MKAIKQSLTASAAADAVLKNGGVIIFPTDTVYGFLADASNKKAVEKIYKIKKRTKRKPLPVFVSSIKMAKEIADIDEHQMKYLKKYWPGKYTFILQRKPGKKFYGLDKKTIAVRIPKYTFLNNLLKKIDRPLVQTSVNISTQEPLNSTEQIMFTFGKSKLIGLIVASSKPLEGNPSKIIDLTKQNAIIIRT